MNKTIMNGFGHTIKERISPQQRVVTTVVVLLHVAVVDEESARVRCSLDPWHMSTLGVTSFLATENNTTYLVECLLCFLVTTTHAFSTKPGVVLGGCHHMEGWCKRVASQ